MDTGSSLFASVIEDHLELKRRNARLDKDLPLNEFSGSDPFENHPLFKTEEQALREELETGEHPALDDLPQETLEIPAVAPEPQLVRTPAEPQGWMDTTASQEFSWD
jgi:hypothetical protein